MNWYTTSILTMEYPHLIRKPPTGFLLLYEYELYAIDVFHG